MDNEVKLIQRYKIYIINKNDYNISDYNYNIVMNKIIPHLDVLMKRFNYSNIQFRDKDLNLIPFFIEDINTGDIWIRNNNSTIYSMNTDYIYLEIFNKPVNLSNGYNTFDLFEDFKSINEFNTVKWDINPVYNPFEFSNEYGLISNNTYRQYLISRQPLNIYNTEIHISQKTSYTPDESYDIVTSYVTKIPSMIRYEQIILLDRYKDNFNHGYWRLNNLYDTVSKEIKDRQIFKDKHNNLIKTKTIILKDTVKQYIKLDNQNEWLQTGVFTYPFSNHKDFHLQLNSKYYRENAISTLEYIFIQKQYDIQLLFYKLEPNYYNNELLTYMLNNIDTSDDEYSDITYDDQIYNSVNETYRLNYFFNKLSNNIDVDILRQITYVYDELNLDIQKQKTQIKKGSREFFYIYKTSFKDINNKQTKMVKLDIFRSLGLSQKSNLIKMDVIKKQI